jgi:hypothetical protein
LDNGLGQLDFLIGLALRVSVQAMMATTLLSCVCYSLFFIVARPGVTGLRQTAEGHSSLALRREAKVRHRTDLRGRTIAVLLSRRDYLKRMGASLVGLTGLGLLGLSCSESREGETQDFPRSGESDMPTGSQSSACANVRKFGAKGDGEADDAEAIQKAIDSIPNRGGTLFFPSGAYRVTAGLEVPNPRVRLLGEGTGSYGESLSSAGGYGSTLIADGQGITLLYVGNDTDIVEQVGPSVEHINFADRTGETATLLKIRLVNRWNLDNCSFRDARVGLLIDSDAASQGGSVDGGDASWGMVHQCHFAKNGYGIHVPYSGGFVVNGGSFINRLGSDQVAIRRKGGSQFRVFGVKVDQGIGIWTEGNGGIIQGSQFEDCDPAIRLDGNEYSSNGRYNKVIGCHFFAPSDSVGVEVTSRAADCKVALNTFSNIDPENWVRNYGEGTQIVS